MLKGRFIGENGSMGFEHGRTYSFFTKVDNGLIKLTVNDFSRQKQLYCYYSNLESLMANWDNLVEFKSVGEAMANVSEQFIRVANSIEKDYNRVTQQTQTGMLQDESRLKSLFGSFRKEKKYYDNRTMKNRREDNSRGGWSIW